MDNESLNTFLTKFFNYIFSDLCNCIKKECNITGLSDNAIHFYKKYIENNNTNNNCNTINIQKNFMVKSIINSFLQFKLLNYDGHKYYILNTHKRLTWRNIKQLDLTNISTYITEFPEYTKELFEFFNDSGDFSKDLILIYIKYIFWYFRKSVIDSIVGNIIKDSKVIGLSVGSTKIDSDYDITLYGSYTNIFETINTFNERIHDTFNNTSEIIFDTNIYGASFITSNFTNSSLNDFSCGNTKFSLSYKSLNPNFFITQHIWSFIKLLTKLNTLQDEIIYEFLRDTLYNCSDNVKKLLLAAEEFINKFDSNVLVYDKIVSLLDKPDLTNDAWETNYISFVNYNGSETYFTRGAFIDVVVNSQMCNGEYIQLTEHELFDSFIENISELLTHFTKDKYINRAKNTLQKIKLKDDTKNIILDLLNQSIFIQNTCKNINSILSCSKFLFLFNCIQCIVNISNEFLCCFEPELGIELFKELSNNFPSQKTLSNIKPIKEYNYKIVSNDTKNNTINTLRKNNSLNSLDNILEDALTI